MKQIALEALNFATGPGVEYADVRVMDSRERAVSIRNGRVSSVASSESMGLGIRVLAGGCWGFAATSRMDREGIEAAARMAREIAHAGGLAKKKAVQLAPVNAYQVTWISPCRIDPFSISVEANIELLLKIDAELRHNTAVTLAEAAVMMDRSRQVFVSSIGSIIDQTKTTCGAGYAAYSFKDNEIQKRSFPNSFGGQ